MFYNNSWDLISDIQLVISPDDRLSEYSNLILQ